MSLAFLGVSEAGFLQALPQQQSAALASGEKSIKPVAGVNPVRGTAVDRSGGVLPGVTVTATTSDGRFLATAVTDEAGKYSFDGLPVGRVRLTFQLDGFGTVGVQLVVQPGAEIDVLERLDLAPLAETVVVQGRAPVAPPPLPSPPVLTPVPAHDQESVCGPAKAGVTAESFGTIRSRRHEAEPALYAKGDQLIIDGGTLSGLETGANVVVRRRYPVSGAGGAPATRAAGSTGEHTSGLLQIVVAGERESTAIVVYACDEMMKGDYLAAFIPEPIRSPEPVGIPNYGDAARILFADRGQLLGAPRRLMVIDRGSEQGIRAGQRLTLFRRRSRGAPTPTDVGDAVVVAVRGDSATIRVERATDVILFGDWAAPQLPQGDASATLPDAAHVEASRTSTP